MAVLADRLSCSSTNTTKLFQNRGVRGSLSSFSATQVVDRIGDVLHLDVGVGLVSGLDGVVP